LWHTYRYRKIDNDKARHFFELALKLDPTFSRAYAGLSLTHFQDAFQNWENASRIWKGSKPQRREFGGDERDPAVHWAMGRALYLRQRWDECEVELSGRSPGPNFALGHYNLCSCDRSSAIRTSPLPMRIIPVA
jgi:hypothetical protein